MALQDLIPLENQEGGHNREIINNMNVYENNKIVGAGEKPNYGDYFTSSSSTMPDAVQKYKRYQTLAHQGTLYLLLPDYERVRVTSWLVEPLLISRVNDNDDLIGGGVLCKCA